MKHNDGEPLSKATLFCVLPSLALETSIFSDLYIKCGVPELCSLLVLHNSFYSHS